MRGVAVGLMAVAVLAACGGGGGATQPSGSTKVTMTEYKFEPSSLTVTSGKVVFFLVNGGSIAHDMRIRDSSGKVVGTSELVSAGDSFVFTVDSIAAGDYTIFCGQPGHESLGMKGTLTVN